MEFEFAKRKNIRAKTYDYSLPGYYFLTICIHAKENLLGYINNGKFCPYENRPDLIISNGLYELETSYTNTKLDEYIIMPNHIHCILQIKYQTNYNLTDMIISYKRKTNYEYRQGVKEKLFKAYNKKFWQENYYDRIIGNEKELYETRKYILENPIKWELDEMYNEQKYNL